MIVPSLVSLLSHRIATAARAVAPDVAGFDPVIRPSQYADLQADGVLALARAHQRNPREMAGLVATQLEPDDVLASCAVAGPGFLNITLTDRALLEQTLRRLTDDRLGLGRPETGTITVIDYSQPNIAKEMHVGHLRSTVIGDALVRLLEHLGGTVVRQSHVGDWGTQFGMLIQYTMEHPSELEAEEPTMSRLATLYRTARIAFDADAAFADRARRRVVALQAGDPDTLAAWREIVAESTRYFTGVYERLGVRLIPADAVGESFYNPMLPAVADDLVAAGVGTISKGAVCVFFDDITGPDSTPTPLIVRKSDGGYGYAATDLAAIRHRVTALHADRIIYVVDARQALHFQMVFAAARRAGWLTDQAVHVPFGTVLGLDGRPFKTRAGDTVRLVDLLESAVDQARQVVAAKNPTLAGAALEERARQVGIGAVKYADLSTSRTRDYTFDPQRMVALAGNTGVYLQYAHARIRSILAKAGDPEPTFASGVPLAASERRLALHLDEFGNVLAEVVATYEPHRLCTYLYGLAQTFTTFYENCPVLKADADVKANRLLLCRLTGDTLRTGLNLLGIHAPDQL